MGARGLRHIIMMDTVNCRAYFRVSMQVALIQSIFRVENHSRLFYFGFDVCTLFPRNVSGGQMWGMWGGLC